MEAERAQHAQARDQIRDEAQAEITRIRDAAQSETSAARAERDQAQRGHTTQLGDLRHQLGGLDQQVTQLTARAETAEHNDQQAAEKLQHWHHELADALAEPGEHNQQLTTRIEQLLAAGSDSAWTRDGLGS